ncbi:MAG: thioesterase family protein, partial [Actinomycetes bacterium]
MTFAFDLATAVTDIGNGAYSGSVHDGWDIRGNANGGYVMALLANAMRTAANRPDPISITLHYLAPLPAGDFEIQTQVVKQGRRFTTVSASMIFGGREAVRAVGAFSDAPKVDG